MTTTTTSPSGTPSRHGYSTLTIPSYLDVGGGRVLSSFRESSGNIEGMEIRRDRARAYPGLASSAPRTEVFYRLFAPYAIGQRVLDIGAGSGFGLVQLEGAASITGVDKSETAVSFARRAVTGIEFLVLDACKEALPQADVGILVDVLSMVESPRELLRQVGKALGEGKLLCVAEARASVAQELLAPAKRAYSKQQLTQLLADAGFLVEDVVSEGAFLALTARRASSDWTQGMDAADQLQAAGLVDEALDLLLSPPRAPGGAIESSWFLRIAEICLSKGDGDGALESLMEAQRRVPEDSRVVARLAEVLLLTGSTEDAGRFAMAAVERDPADARAVSVLAEATASSLPGLQGVALWSNALKLDPTNVDLAVKLAAAASNIGAFYVGITALERVREYHEKLPADFHLTLGWLYLMASRFDDALLECRLASITAPEHSGISELIAAVCEARPRPVGVS